MFTLNFKYNHKCITLANCYGLSFSPAGRVMYVKVKSNGRVITQSYCTKFVTMFSLCYLSIKGAYRVGRKF